MGALYKFECPACGHIDFVSGGRTQTKRDDTITIECLDEQLLFEVSSVAVVCCPNDRTHTWAPWMAPPAHCPKCSSKMVKDEADAILVD